MAVEIKQYTPQMELEVKEFNRRLKKGGIPFSFPESYVSGRLPHVDNRKIFEDYYLAIQDDMIVRGGYIFKHQDFSLNGGVKSIGNIQLPLSEGTINKAYNMIGLRLINDALKRQPVLYALGMGGVDNPFPRFLRSMGWRLVALSFYFKILRPHKFLKNINVLRTSRMRTIFLNLLAYSGLGWVGIKILPRLLRRKSFVKKMAEIEVVPQFYVWADELWDRSKNNFSFCAVRDTKTLNILYPSENEIFIRLKVTVDSEVIGWALVLATQMSGHKEFGNMRVGSIIDCLALQGSETYLIGAVSEYLTKRGVDLIVSNQSYEAYAAAFKKQGFFEGPSNFIFAASKKLTELLQPFELNVANMHVNRGDGDGPMNL